MCELSTNITHAVFETCSACAILKPQHMLIPFLLKGKSVNNHTNMRTEVLRNQPMAHKDNLSRDIVPRVIIIQAIYKKSATSAACKLISFIGMAGWAFTKIALNSTALSFCEKSSWWISNLVFYFLTTSAFMILPGTNTRDSVFQCCAGSREGSDILETSVHCLETCKEII